MRTVDARPIGIRRDVVVRKSIVGEEVPFGDCA
jgi:hypothetical protein